MVTKSWYDLKFLQFEKPLAHPISHALSMRTGGFSEAPYDSLNIALHVGDNLENVIKNREAFLKSSKLPTTLIEMNQTHSTNVVLIDKTTDIKKSFKGENIIKDCDGVITKQKNITLCTMAADCTSSLFYDSKNHVIGLAHAGWRGAIDNINSKMIDSFKNNFGTNVEDLLVCIAPNISAKHFEIGEEIFIEANSIYKEDSSKFLYTKENKYHLNVEELLLHQLFKLGVTNIETSGVCNFVEEELFFSYRRDGEKTGRFGLFASLN